MHIHWTISASLIAVVNIAWFSDAALGQTMPNNSAASHLDSPDEMARAVDTETADRSLLEVFTSMGMTGLLIILLLVALSTGAVALTIEHLMTIRQSVLIPPGLGDQLREQLALGKMEEAAKSCHAHPSLLGFIVRAGLAEVGGGWAAMEKAMEEAIAQQAARLFRKVEYLSVIGNIAPMIGLLGTVTGMIFAFQEVADTQGAARAGQLAEGIYTALITTVGGLLVAIPSLAAFAVFRNRIDQLVAEAAYVAQHAVAPIKRTQTRRQRGAASPPSPTVPGDR